MIVKMISSRNQSTSSNTNNTRDIARMYDSNLSKIQAVSRQKGRHCRTLEAISDIHVATAITCRHGNVKFEI